MSSGKRRRLRKMREAFCRKCAAHEEFASSIVASEDVDQGSKGGSDHRAKPGLVMLMNSSTTEVGEERQPMKFMYRTHVNHEPTYTGIYHNAIKVTYLNCM